MSNIKTQLAALLVWFALFFNLNFFLPEGETLPPFIYIYSIAIVGLLLVVPRLVKINFAITIVATLAVYSGLYILTASETSTTTLIVGGAATIITLSLMRWLCARLLEFDLAAQNFIVGRGTFGLLTTTEGEQKMEDELYRARRFERPLSLVYCTLPENKKDGGTRIESELINWQINRSLKNRYQQIQLARLASNLIHKGDLMIEYQHGVVVVLPETNMEEAKIFINQLGHAVTQALGINPIIGMSNFPEEGLVYEDLVKEAEASAKPWNQDDPNTGHPRPSGDTMSHGNGHQDIQQGQSTSQIANVQ